MTLIGRMMNEAITLAARIVRALALTITAPATMAATWQMVESASATSAAPGKKPRPGKTARQYTARPP